MRKPNAAPHDPSQAAPASVNPRADLTVAESFSAPYRHAYLVGHFVAVNAISDAYAIIDGPDCNYRKAEWVFGSHDFASTLLDALGRHRVVPTLVNAEGVIQSVGNEVVRRIRRVAQLGEAGVCLVSSMPHVTIIGTQYGRLLEQLRDEVPFPLVELPSRSLDGDWLDGYAETLTALARTIDVRDASPGPRRVAIIGHLMDRTEQDQRANVAELERLVRAIGLDVTSVWLSGRPYAHLVEAKHAAVLLALPHGLAAAQALAKRTGAKAVAIPTPFGLGQTQRMLRTIAQAYEPPRGPARGGSHDAALAASIAEAVDALIEAELARLVPRLEWIVPRLLLGKSVAFSGDPALFPGLVQFCAELGMEVVHLSAPNRRPPFYEDVETVEGEPIETVFAGPLGRVVRRLADISASRGLDVIIGNTRFSPARSAGTARTAFLELGFPSQGRHALSERPFLGFQGWVCFLDDLVRVIMEAVSRMTPSSLP